MGEYIRKIIGAVFFVSVITSVLPDESGGKIAKFSSGLVVFLAIIAPLTNVSKSEWTRFSRIETVEISMENENYIKEEFENTLEEKMKEILKNETGENIDIKIISGTDENGSISKIESAEIKPYTERCAKITAENLGISIDMVVEME